MENTASLTAMLQGPFNYERQEESFDYVHYLGERCIQDFIEESLRVVTPNTHVRVIVEVYDDAE